jgi:hypothetical protein
MTTETMPAKAPEYVSDDADMKAFKRGWNALHDAITARRSAASAEPASPAAPPPRQSRPWR